MRKELDALHFRPLTPQHWSDLETLFGARGGCGGCWCMWWRLRRSEWEKQKGEKNQRAFRKLVVSGAPAGVLAYLRSEPIGWCAIAPREDYSALARSRVLKPVDNQSVWSVTCFYVAKKHRRNGLPERLLQAAVQYAYKHGAKIIEGYPHDPRSGEMPEAFAWTGFVSPFRNAGFKEVARRSATRPVMRRTAND